MRILILALPLLILGCSTTFRGNYTVVGATDTYPKINQQQANDLRDNLLKALESCGFMIRSSVELRGTNLAASFVATLRPENLRSHLEEFASLRPSIHLYVGFTDNYVWVFMEDSSSYHETQVILKLREILENEFTKIDPPLRWRFRVNRVKFD